MDLTDVAAGTVGAITGYIAAAPTVVGVVHVLGFGTAGVGAGTWAASVMTATTAAGSWFAVAQSIGATGALAGAGAILVPAVGAGAVGGAAYFGVRALLALLPPG